MQRVRHLDALGLGPQTAGVTAFAGQAYAILFATQMVAVVRQVAQPDVADAFGLGVGDGIRYRCSRGVAGAAGSEGAECAGGSVPDQHYLGNDDKFWKRFKAVAEGTYIEVVRIPPHSPNLNPICERFFGSLRIVEIVHKCGVD